MKIYNTSFILGAGFVFLVLVAYVAYATLNVETDNGRSITGVTVGDDDEAGGSRKSLAKAQIVEFSDFQCPYCVRVVPTLKQIGEDYGDTVEIIFKHFPLDFHTYAKKSAEAAECARDQGKFWEYHDILFENQNRLKIDDLKRYAKDIGLDTSTFNSCLDGGKKSSIVEKDLAEGSSRGVRGTPTFFINDQLFVGAQLYEKFAEIIDVMIEANSGEESGTELEEVNPLPTPTDSGSCGGACGRPTCGARTGGSCGCGG